ncbi:MAG: hypothetical protein A2V72_01250 [Candidatus Nealsonbacteria bacterium RBG_13_37_56]|uniref:Uncharacterized protein n=1 Tax=Candidatus Nealsonbacteria bacterium RBG_13_37_56 TaxID=1801661 RepID=A0A1G2DWV9_9BACT|nr:MAG: hypothetical protein A2V72_01250 [Candidatus Nealsonbacteria bacterium RBG_13_37_56]
MEKVVMSLIVVAVIAVLFFAFFGGVFVSESRAIKCLETQGYSDIEIINHAWFMIGLRGGDTKDAARFTVMATNPVGRKVKVYVFTGFLFKGATIRTL